MKYVLLFAKLTRPGIDNIYEFKITK